MRLAVALFLFIIAACDGAPLHRLSTSDIPGIHSPRPINPVVDIPDDRFLFDL